MDPIGFRVLLAVGCFFIATGGCSGAPEYVLVGSARAPGADGAVETEEIDGEGMRIMIHMERLPPPRHLGEDLKAYVVWFEGEGRKRIRAGVLAYNEGARTGDLTGTSPFTKTRIRITAEVDGEVPVPGKVTIVERVLSKE